MSDWNGVRRVLAAVAVAGMTAAPALAADDPAFGLWLVQTKRAVVEIGPCDSAPEKACGKIVWLLEPNDAAGKPRTDEFNPDAAMKSRPLCGLPVVGDFDKTAAGEWENGFIYDSNKGDTYTSYMEVQADGTLKVRGYIGVPLLGKSQIWTREADNHGGC